MNVFLHTSERGFNRSGGKTASAITSLAAMAIRGDHVVMVVQNKESARSHFAYLRDLCARQQIRLPSITKRLKIKAVR